MTDSADPPRSPSRDLPPQTLAALKVALATHLRDSSPDGDLRRALQEACREARTRGLRAEELLIAFKRLWYELPEVRATQIGESRDRLLARVVTMCIREYYDSDAG
ncbi:MAG: hypothetical protein M3068_01175 [Gemmatimonadota bacterium]|nr:hypothetical protein [Gemmatimonadota bacterium]